MVNHCFQVLEKLYRARWVPEDGVGCIIISRTRELADQTFDELKIVGKHHAFSAGLLIGGRKDVATKKQHADELYILIRTAGRLLQHMDETVNFECSQLQILVLDETDRILDKRFKMSLNNIISQLPKDRQTLLFSATQTKSVQDLARLSLKDPEYLGVHEEAERATPDRLEQIAMIVPLEQKLDMLWSFIKTHLNCKILVFLLSREEYHHIYGEFPFAYLREDGSGSRNAFLPGILVNGVAILCVWVCSFRDLGQGKLLFHSPLALEVLNRMLVGASHPGFGNEDLELSIKVMFLGTGGSCLLMKRTSSLIPLAGLLGRIKPWRPIEVGYCVPYMHPSSSTLVVYNLADMRVVRFVFEAFKKLPLGIPIKCLHGRMKQEKRMAIYSQFCEQRSVLFSTDVASRGFDFNKAVDWVVQVDCPEDVAGYTYRVGRTARYQSGGRSVLFLMPSEIEMLEKLKAAKVPIKNVNGAF
ncbi:Helicase, C-terminal [Dillenia turbinata]|uniref:ATP-dependent RNA helicase n=1 Tax=Dillenia turbinata TaxID=194707 RepID=A0AAN8ZU33_9MAGN